MSAYIAAVHFVKKIILPPPINRLDSGPSKVRVMARAAVVASAVNLAIPQSTAMLLFLVLCFFQGIGLSIISTLGNIVLCVFARALRRLYAMHVPLPSPPLTPPTINHRVPPNKQQPKTKKNRSLVALTYLSFLFHITSLLLTLQKGSNNPPPPSKPLRTPKQKARVLGRPSRTLAPGAAPLLRLRRHPLLPHPGRFWPGRRCLRRGRGARKAFFVASSFVPCQSPPHPYTLAHKLTGGDGPHAGRHRCGGLPQEHQAPPASPPAAAGYATSILPHLKHPSPLISVVTPTSALHSGGGGGGRGRRAAANH